MPRLQDDEVKLIAERLIGNAHDYAHDLIRPSVERARRYVSGEVDQAPAGAFTPRPGMPPEYQGSRAVVSECRDVVETLVPELVRIFTGSDNPIEFLPHGPEDVEGAKQATDYVNSVIWEENKGATLTDEMIRLWLNKFAALRVYIEQEDVDEDQDFTGLDEAALAILEADPAVVKITARPQGEFIELPTPKAPSAPAEPGSIGQIGQQMEAASQPAAPPVQVQPVMAGVYEVLYDGTYTRRETKRRLRIRLLRQEEFLIDPTASCVEDAVIVGIETLMRATEVVELGVDPDTVAEFAGGGRPIYDNADPWRYTNESGDRSLDWVRVVDAKVKLDKDGDGIVECYRVLALGDTYTVVQIEKDPGSDEYIVGSPLPRPHHIIGDGVVEQLYDLQEQQTALIRRTLDNLDRATNPRPMTNSQDAKTLAALQSWRGGVVPYNQGDEVNWYAPPYVGQYIQPVQAWMDERRVLRTGISPASQGLDPNVLKGQTVEAAMAIVSGPQSRIEYYARRFAETIFRPLAEALLRLSVAFQDKPQIVRLRGNFVEVDPRKWKSDFDASPRVGLGTGSVKERMAARNIVLQQQMFLLDKGSDAVDMSLLLNTIEDLLADASIKNFDRYFHPMTSEQAKQISQQKGQAAQQQQLQQLQAQSQAQAMVGSAVEKARGEANAMVEQVRAQSQTQIAQAKTESDARIQIAKQQADAQLQAAQAEHDASIKVQVEQIKAANEIELARMSASIELEKERLKLEMQERLKLAEIEAERVLQEIKLRAQTSTGTEVQTATADVEDSG